MNPELHIHGPATENHKLSRRFNADDTDQNRIVSRVGIRIFLTIYLF